jgi:hypothetical protein
MPFGTITSTENTFGTVNGAVSGSVEGTLTGSVGVPGPAGAPGVGVPAGGTSGQFLQKTSDVSYETDWVTVNLAGLATESWVTAGFYPLSGNPSGFLTAASLSGYATESFVTSQGYITSAALSPYITSATATASFYPLSGNPSGFLTSAPVTSVAGKVGVVTLDNTDISGLGTLAVVNDAPSDGSQYARKNGAWDVVTTAPDFISSVSSPLAVATGNLTVDLSAYAPLASPAFTGTPTAPTPSPGTDSTQIATTAWVKNFDYAPTNSPTLTGNPKSVTPSTGDNDTSIATTAFVKAQNYITSSALTPYLTTADAASTYALKTNGELKGNFTLDGTAASPNSDGSILIGSTFAGYDFLDIRSGRLEGRQGTPQKTFTLDATDGLKLFSSGLGVRFPDASVQTVAYPGPSGFLLKADNLSGLADTGTARTNLGLGTMATATAADYSTTTVANGLYYPLSSNPAGYLTTAPVTSVAGRTGAVTLAVADVSGAAAIDSQAFTGTPSLPTGTIGVTQTAGNNTTALATTAFVTAAVPAFATAAQARAFTSTTTAINPRQLIWAMLSQDVVYVNRQQFTFTNVGTISYTISGSIGTVTRPGTAGACSSRARIFGVSQVDQTDNQEVKTNPKNHSNYSLRKIFSGRSRVEIITDTNFTWAWYHGKAEADGVGDLTRRGFGWKMIGGAGSRFLLLQVHNGTTLTSVTSSYAVTANVAFDWDIESDGAGNVTLYVNGTSVATSSAGPTGLVNLTPTVWQEEMQAAAALASSFNDTAHSRGRYIVISP